MVDFELRRAQSFARSAFLSHADGWEGATYQVVSADGTVATSGTLDDGGSDLLYVCLPDGDYELEFTAPAGWGDGADDDAAGSDARVSVAAHTEAVLAMSAAAETPANTWALVGFGAIKPLLAASALADPPALVEAARALLTALHDMRCGGV